MSAQPEQGGTPGDANRFLRGVCGTRSRLAETVRPRLPHDTWDTAEIPAGARLEFLSRAEAVVVTIQTLKRHPLAAPTMPDAISLWSGEDFVGAFPIPAGGGEVKIELPLGVVCTLYLPEALPGGVTSLRPVNGHLEPGPIRPRWLAYGDSITQGWSATDPGRCYPALAGRRYGLDVWNLGFAGSARGEIAAAQYIAATEADVISLAFGTNNWSVLPTGPAHLAGILHDFIAVIRFGHPSTPIVVVSPIIRPDAEEQPNVTGATLADLRHALEDTTRLLAVDDRALCLVSGQDLVTADQLTDGIHPGDSGHRAMAGAVGSAIEQQLVKARAAAAAEEVSA